jgi:type IV secretory pathway TrbD component
MKASYPIYRSMVQEPRLGGVPRRLWLAEAGLVLIALYICGGGIVTWIALALAVVTLHPVAIWLTSIDELWLDVTMGALSYRDRYEPASDVAAPPARPLRALSRSRG